MIQAARFRVLGEREPRLEHRHGPRWVKMQRSIPTLTEDHRSYRGTWMCPECREVVLHQWRAQ
jgi:hypothetical protein